MSRSERLWLVRAAHTAIYVVMVACVLAVVSGARETWVWISAGLVGLEAVVFLGNGLKCPLTALVVKYRGLAEVSDTFLPERITRHTFTVFGPLIVLGYVLLAVRWLR